MSETRDLLIEIGTEELPPKALLRLSQAFTDGVRKGLEQAGLAFGTVHSYAAPRRLAIWIEQLTTAQSDREQIRRGPALTAAFDGEGNATPGAQGFARSCGVSDGTIGSTGNGQGCLVDLSRHGTRPRHCGTDSGHRHASTPATTDSQAHAVGRRYSRVRAAGALDRTAVRRCGDRCRDPRA